MAFAAFYSRVWGIQTALQMFLYALNHSESPCLSAFQKTWYYEIQNIQKKRLKIHKSEKKFWSGKGNLTWIDKFLA